MRIDLTHGGAAHPRYRLVRLPSKTLRDLGHRETAG
jgi:hypothetical protein